MKILVYELNSEKLALFKSQLSSWGFEVFVGKTKSEAWKIFQTESPGIVLLGGGKKSSERNEICKDIRKLTPKNKHYVLFLFSSPSEKKMMEALDAGADDFLYSSAHLPELRAKLKSGERIIELQRELEIRLRKLEESNKLIEKNNECMRRDVYAVAKIQASLLPASLPKVPTVEFAWEYKPREELAGDGLNVIRLDENHVAFYVLDVSGRGTSAALLSVSLSRQLSPFPSQSTLLKYLIKTDPGYAIRSPGQVLKGLNETFPLDLEIQHYFTILYGILNLETFEVCYSIAGHPQPFMLQEGKLKRLPGGGFPIGFVEDAEFEENSVIMKPGDRFFIYSDGLSEAQASKKDQFGKTRFAKSLQKNHNCKLKDCLTKLLDDAENWTAPYGLRDDVSILAFEFLGGNKK